MLEGYFHIIQSKTDLIPCHLITDWLTQQKRTSLRSFYKVHKMNAKWDILSVQPYESLISKTLSRFP